MPPSAPRERFLPSRRFGILGTCLVVIVVLTTGCAQRYAILTTTGGTLYSKGRPKLVQGYYVYQNAEGGEERINQMRVRAIEAQ